MGSDTPIMSDMRRMNIVADMVVVAAGTALRQREPLAMAVGAATRIYFEAVTNESPKATLRTENSAERRDAAIAFRASEKHGRRAAAGV